MVGAGAVVVAEQGAVRTWSVEELRASRRRVPAAPGVYTFLDAYDAPLYVGKSVDLRRRLASYFAANPARRKTARLVGRARRVRAERTGSEFAALLREADLVQALRPPFNQRMAAPERYVYLRIDYAHAFPRVSVTGVPSEEGRYLGPFIQRARVEAVVDGLNDAFRLRTCEPLPIGAPCWRLQMRRCSGPCVAAIDSGEYGRQFLLAREALGGRSREALRRLSERRDEHAGAERFESARAVQNRIDAVERLRRVLFASQVPPLDAIVVQPALAPGAVELWAIGDGAVRFAGSADHAKLKPLFDRAWTALRTTVRNIGPVEKLELDRRCIVRQWLRSNCGVASSVLIADMPADAAWENVADLARRQVQWLL